MDSLPFSASMLQGQWQCTAVSSAVFSQHMCVSQQLALWCWELFNNATRLGGDAGIADL